MTLSPGWLARCPSSTGAGVSVLLGDGQVARLERTSAFTRAARVVAAGEDLDDAVDDVSGTWWFDGARGGVHLGRGARDAEPAAEGRPAGERKPKKRGGSASRADVDGDGEEGEGAGVEDRGDDSSIGDKARRVLRRRPR